jgi:hypothetical protein
MPGRAALSGTSDAMADIRATRKGENTAGISGSDTSKLGLMGRMGGDANGQLVDPAYTRIDAEVVHKGMNGTADGGQMGFESGSGRTFGGGGSRRKED